MMYKLVQRYSGGGFVAIGSPAHLIPMVNLWDDGTSGEVYRRDDEGEFRKVFSGSGPACADYLRREFFLAPMPDGVKLPGWGAW